MKLDVSDLLARSWRISWRHKALWLLGFLVALPGGCSGGSNFAGRFQSRGDAADLPRNLEDLGGGLEGLTRQLPAGLRDYLAQLLRELATLRQSNVFTDRPMVWVGLALLLLAGLFLVWLVLALVGLVARVGLVRSIDRIDAGDEAPTLREAWRLGWSVRTLRLLLAEFLMALLALLLILPVLVLAILPFILGIVANSDGGGGLAILGLLAGIGIFVMGIFLFMVLAALLNVFRELWGRDIMIADAPIGSAVAEGLATMRRHPGDIFRLWLALLLVGIGVGLALLPLTLLLALLAIGLGLGLGALILALFGGLLGGFGALISLLLGLALSATVFGLPLAVVQGLYQVFGTSAWTLAWRRLRGELPPPTYEAPSRDDGAAMDRATAMPPLPEGPIEP